MEADPASPFPAFSYQLSRPRRNGRMNKIWIAAALLALPLPVVAQDDPGIPPGWPYIESVTPTGESSVLLSWTAPGADGVEGTAESYEIRVTTMPPSGISLMVPPADGMATALGDWNEFSEAFYQGVLLPGAPKPEEAGTPQTLAVTGLLPDTAYWFAVVAYDSAGNPSSVGYDLMGDGESGWFWWGSAKTPDWVAPAATTLNVGSVTATSITLQWISAGDNGNQGNATKHEILMSTNPGFFGATNVTVLPSPGTPGSAKSKVVSNLAPDTTYHFKLRTFDEVNNASPDSNIAVATTVDSLAPTTTGNLSVVRTTATSVTLAWTAPSDSNGVGPVVSYDLRYSVSGPITADVLFTAATPADGEPLPAAPGETEEVTIEGLVTGQTYSFALKSSDEVPNWSALSNEVSATATAAAGPLDGSTNTATCSSGSGAVLPLGLALLAVIVVPTRRRTA